MHLAHRLAGPKSLVVAAAACWARPPHSVGRRDPGGRPHGLGYVHPGAEFRSAYGCRSATRSAIREWQANLFLRAGTDEREWVQYLQQLLQYWGWWDREHDGVFSPELEAAVQGVQRSCGIPASGVVDEATWIVLTADETTIVGHDAGTAPAEEVPASFSVGGVPAFQYNWPLSEPVAATEFEAGAAHVKVELYLKGSCTVTFPNAPAGITVDVMSGGMRAQAAVAVGQLTEGLRINGLGTETPSLGATVSSEFYQAEVRFAPPAIVFIGSAKLSFEVESELSRSARSWCKAHRRTS
jgi:Putative peptidoglycan binding domain